MEKPIRDPIHHVISKTPLPDHVQYALDGSISDPESSNEHVICPTCMETVLYREWRDHTYRHVKFKPFRCTCGLQFFYASNAKLHAKARNTSPRYPCSFCHKTFARKDALEAHGLLCKSRHQIEPAIPDVDMNLMSEYPHSVIHLQNEGPAVGADTRQHPIDALESVFMVPSSYEYELDRLISSAVNTPLPQSAERVWKPPEDPKTLTGDGTGTDVTQLSSSTAAGILPPSHSGSDNEIDHIASESGGKNKADTREGPALESNDSQREHPEPLTASQKQECEQTAEHQNEDVASLPSDYTLEDD